MTRILHWFYMWKMDPMSCYDICLVFILPPRHSTLQYKKCVHLWNNFPWITSLGKEKKKKTEDYKRKVGTVKKEENDKNKLHRQSNSLSIVMFKWISILEELRKKIGKEKKKEIEDKVWTVKKEENDRN